MANADTLTPLHHCLEKGKRTHYVRGDTITTTEETDSVFLVKTGFVKRFQITSSGAINVQSIYGPGDVFSLTYIFQLLFKEDIYRGPDTYYYEAMDETEIFRFPGVELKAIAKGDPLIYRDLLEIAGHRFQSNIKLLENKSLPNAVQRVAHIMLFYIEQYKAFKGDGYELIVPLTQQDIADVLSLTRESVSSAISTLRKDKVLVGTRTLLVPSLDTLREVAYS
jgi:CRP/FNR family cyclic AMP-dependent transcriptional regulator